MSEESEFQHNLDLETAAGSALVDLSQALASGDIEEIETDLRRFLNVSAHLESHKKEEAEELIDRARKILNPQT